MVQKKREAVINKKPVEPDRGRVWNLPPDKAAYLEKQFAEKGNVLVYEDGVFYDAEEWQKKRGLFKNAG
jgi:hypothetical protein